MPTLNDARIELENFFILGWAGRTPVVFDGMDKDPQGIPEWVNVVMVPYSSHNAAIGNGLNSGGKIRDNGIFTIAINTLINKGSGAAWALSDQVKEVMVNKHIVTDLWTGAGNSRRSGAEPNGYYGVIVSVDFTTDYL